MSRQVPMMRPLAATLMVLLAVGVLGCSSGGGADQSGVQERFGVRMAKMNLWREAMFRFKRAVEMDPEDAMAHNNLAVAYEANGEFEDAAKEYREAIRLDKSNQYIQKNYSRFVEFTSRNRKRQQRAPSSQTAAGDAPSAATTEAAPDPPAPVPAQVPATTTAPPVEPPHKPPGGLS